MLSRQDRREAFYPKPLPPKLSRYEEARNGLGEKHDAEFGRMIERHRAGRGGATAARRAASALARRAYGAQGPRPAVACSMGGHRLQGLEQSSADDGHQIGRDPRAMTTAELNELDYHSMPLLAVIRARCLDCVGHEPGEVRKCVAVDSPNWPYRMSHNPFRVVSEAQREVGRRLGARRAAHSENARLIKPGFSGSPIAVPHGLGRPPRRESEMISRPGHPGARRAAMSMGP
jgi:hypothetical protein